jgi:hypothetical protein
MLFFQITAKIVSSSDGSEFRKKLGSERNTPLQKLDLYQRKPNLKIMDESRSAQFTQIE